jgi:hypothetical protein
VGGEMIIACKMFVGITEVQEAVAQWVNSSESFQKFKLFDFHEMLKYPADGQNKVSRITDMPVSKQFVSICTWYRALY